MKKINSIGYGGKILGSALVFMLVIPGGFRIAMYVCKNTIFADCAKISFGIGFLILFFLIALLAVELHQDKKQAMFYEARKNEKYDLGDGNYECQACGNRRVKAEDKNCSVCDILFHLPKM